MRTLPTIYSAAAALTAMAGGIAATAQDAAPDLPDTGAMQRGQAVVVGAQSRQVGGECFNCHGMDGAGDAAAGYPRLTDQVYKYLYDSLRDYASGVRQSDIMGPIAEALTDDEMRDVSFYYAAIEDAPYGAPPEADGHLLQQGAVIAAVGAEVQGVQACVNCHGPEGVGLPPTYPFLAGQDAGYLADQLEAWRTGRRLGDGFGIMEHIAKAMTETQIRAVSLYYASLRPDRVTPERGATGAGMVAVGRNAAGRGVGR